VFVVTRRSLSLLTNNTQKKLKRINLLIKNMQKTPNKGIGKPEPLKHGLSGCWSRRINEEHRIVCKQQDGCILTTQLRYHYGT
jgi:toxin YoeB